MNINQSNSGFRGPQGLPIGTASRLTTGMVPGTARPGTRGANIGSGITLHSQVQIADRLVTQQGLGGPKTAANRGGQRMVQDKTYFSGILRSKMNDINSEITKMQTEINVISEEQSSFVTYEKRAETLAQELKDLQAELADYNTLVDKMNTDSSVSDMQMDYNELKAQNEREELSLEGLFEQKQMKEAQVKELETNLQNERIMAETMISDMNDEMKVKYKKLKEQNDLLLKKLESQQQELDALNQKQIELEEELSFSPVKQEAVRLHEQLNDIEARRDQMLVEMQSTLTPQEERQKLLKQVKDDNAEIAVMEKKIIEMQKSILKLQEEIQQVEEEMDINHGERSQQYKELKKREETMDEFMNSFEQNKKQEMLKLPKLESSIVENLEKISRNYERDSSFPILPGSDKTIKKKDDSNGNTSNETRKLQENLNNLEDLEMKMREESSNLTKQLETMNSEMESYRNIDKIRREAEEKKKKLAEEKINLRKQLEAIQVDLEDESNKHGHLQKKLEQNDLYNQINNLEKKWQALEKTNFEIKEFIADKTKGSNYLDTSKRVVQLVKEYNQFLVDSLTGNMKKNQHLTF